MAGRLKSVVVSTDGARDYVALPDGVKLILGTVSVARLIVSCCPDRRYARQALDRFLAEGETMVVLDLDIMGELLAPTKRRWATNSPSMLLQDQGVLTKGTKEGLSTMTQTPENIVANIGNIESQVSYLNKLASDKLPTEKAITGLRDLIGKLHFTDFGDQSKNDAFMGLGEPQVDTVEDPPQKLPESVTGPKTAASVAALLENARIADDILSKVDETSQKVEALKTAGRKFNASAAQSDLHVIAADVHTLLTEVDLAQPYVKTDLTRLAEQADKIHALFVDAK